MIKKILKSLTLLVFVIPCHGQVDTVQLLTPTGKFPVGTATYEWIDESRKMKIEPDVFENRAIITQIWYPSALHTNLLIAPYSALSSDYRNTHTNSYLRAPFAQEVNKCPLIIIAPGRGTERYMYTTIAEELASNGFIVASVDFPEIGYVLYQDGFVLKPSKEFRMPKGMISGPYEKVDSFYEKATEIGYQDLLFVIDKLSSLNNNDSNNKLQDKIDMKNIGIFGHSLGGRIAGMFAARYEDVKAFAAMEGIAPRDVRYEGKINVPSLMLCGSETLKYAIDNYNIFIDNRKNVVYMTELIDFGHNSLTDNPYIYPKSFGYEIDSKKALEISRALLTEFFNEYLQGKAGFYEQNKDKEFVKMVKHQ